MTTGIILSSPNKSNTSYDLHVIMCLTVKCASANVYMQKGGAIHVASYTLQLKIPVMSCAQKTFYYMAASVCRQDEANPVP